MNISTATLGYSRISNGYILNAIDKYNPKQDVILLLELGNKVSFFYLKNLPITKAFA